MRQPCGEREEDWELQGNPGSVTLASLLLGPQVRWASRATNYPGFTEGGAFKNIKIQAVLANQDSWNPIFVWASAI